MFTSTQTLFADVKQTLNSFDSAGLINDADLFRHVSYLMTQIGTSATKDRSIMIDVVKHKAELPEDFLYLQGVYLCDISCVGGGGVQRAYYGSPVTYNYRDWVSTICYDKCDVCYDNKEYTFTRSISRDIPIETYRIDSRTPLSINKNITKQKCHTDCINVGIECGYSFHILDKTIYTNFEEGSINLEYYAMPIDEDGYPEVIDQPVILDAFENYLIYKSLQKLYYNGDADTMQRMQYAEAKYKESFAQVMHFIKLPTWLSLVNYSKERKKYLNLFNIPSHADYNVTKTNGSRIQQYTQRS